jgi:hypothetical protein
VAQQLRLLKIAVMVVVECAPPVIMIVLQIVVTFVMKNVDIHVVLNVAMVVQVHVIQRAKMDVANLVNVHVYMVAWIHALVLVAHAIKRVKMHAKAVPVDV